MVTSRDREAFIQSVEAFIQVFILASVGRAKATIQTMQSKVMDTIQVVDHLAAATNRLAFKSLP